MLFYILFILGMVAWSVFYITFIEYILHKYIMHKRIPYFEYPFERHTGTHHHVFKADDSYHVQREEDIQTIPMAWWNGPALIVVASILPVIASIFGRNIWIAIIPVIIGALYYGAYEYMHWCMHKPDVKRWWLEKPGIGRLFRKLNGHHILHHRYMNVNFNVVAPIWDYFLKTLMARSKIKFAQVQVGLLVPDVQPKL
jgi:hypothetical protein